MKKSKQVKEHHQYDAEFKFNVLKLHEYGRRAS